VSFFLHTRQFLQSSSVNFVGEELTVGLFGFKRGEYE